MASLFDYVDYSCASRLGISDPQTPLGLYGHCPLCRAPRYTQMILDSVDGMYGCLRHLPLMSWCVDYSRLYGCPEGRLSFSCYGLIDRLFPTLRTSRRVHLSLSPPSSYKYTLLVFTGLCVSRLLSKSKTQEKFPRLVTRLQCGQLRYPFSFSSWSVMLIGRRGTHLPKNICLKVSNSLRENP